MADDLLLIGWLLTLFAVPLGVEYLLLAVFVRWRGRTFGYGRLANVVAPLFPWAVGYLLFKNVEGAPKSIANFAEFMLYGATTISLYLPSAFMPPRGPGPVRWTALALGLMASSGFVALLFFLTPMWPETSMGY